MRVRRPRHLWFRLQDKQLVQLEALLRGTIEISAEIEISVCVPAAGFASTTLSPDAWELLRKLPASRWVDFGDAPEESEQIRALADKGIVLTDEDDPCRERMREADAAITANQWSDVAALFFTASDAQPSGAKDSPGQDIATLASRSPDAYRDYVARVGTPPPAFFRVDEAEQRRRLPMTTGDGELFELLERRRTCRIFDRARALPSRDLALILQTVAGVRGVTSMTDDVTLLRKTSPSGGSLHPIEVYPIVLNVEGFESGLYHYDCRAHELARLRAQPRGELEDAVVAFAGTQPYARDAHVLLVFVARFLRSFWKYRHSSRAYSVLAMDIGHLSQTCYLTCAQLGLGTFFSAAIDAEAISAALQLRPFAQGPMGICGFGIPDSATDGGALPRKPYTRPD